MFLNGDTCESLPRCPVGAKFDLMKKTCVCEKNGFNILNGECINCPLNSIWNGNKCTCNASYVELGGVCTFICGKNQVL